MFGFGQQAYAADMEGSEAQQKDASDEMETGTAAAGRITAPQLPAPGSLTAISGTVEAPVSSTGGAVQDPIGKAILPDSKSLRWSQTFALVAFGAVHLTLFLAICALFVFLTNVARVVFIAIAGAIWLVLLLFNLRLAGRPRKVLQSFLDSKKKSKLTSTLEPGSVVVVRGMVSLLHEELLSTEFHNVPGLVLVESSLRSYHSGVGRTDTWTEHVRQTRAVDFKITDALSGGTAIVKAYSAAEAGTATPLVHVSTEVPLSTAVPLAPSPATSAPSTGPRAVETLETGKVKKTASATPQLMVCKGYIRQGQVVTIMGELHKTKGTNELYITPLVQPYNVSKFLLYRRFLPFFFPTWVTGLIVSDQRDVL